MMKAATLFRRSTRLAMVTWFCTQFIRSTMR